MVDNEPGVTKEPGVIEEEPGVANELGVVEEEPGKVLEESGLSLRSWGLPK